MTENHLQDFWKLRLMGALVMSGVIVASSGGYAFATPCLPGQPCPQPTIPVDPDPGHPLPQVRVNKEALPTSNRAATAGRSTSNTEAKTSDPATLNRLEQLAPNYRQQLQQSAPINQVR